MEKVLEYSFSENDIDRESSQEGNALVLIFFPENEQ